MKDVITHIAIDGPVASGKGTVARELSKRLGIPCLDTGAIYRGVGLFFHVTDPKILELTDSSAKNLHAAKLLEKINMDVKIVDGVTRIYLDGMEVTGKIRENDVSRLAAFVATIIEVRDFCTKKSQSVAKNTSLVMEGRDICNVVLPNAKYKFLLTADVNVRAKRRYDELIAKGQNVSFAEVLKQTEMRDKSDMEKGGLKQINDAIIIDATNLTVTQVVEQMLQYVKN